MQGAASQLPFTTPISGCNGANGEAHLDVPIEAGTHPAKVFAGDAGSGKRSAAQTVSPPIVELAEV